MMKIYINGRFLTHRVSGVQRFGRELVKALDQYLSYSESEEDDRWILIAPFGTVCDLDLTIIEFEAAGKSSGHIWEQLELFRFTRAGMLLNFCNSGPILHSHSWTIIHDAMIYRTPSNYSKKYRTAHKLLDKLIVLRSQIGTVSEFSRSELNQLLNLKSSFIVSNGCDHLKQIVPDQSVLKKLRVRKNGYFLFVGSPTTNKNLALIIDAFQKLDNDKPMCVVVGSPLPGIFGSRVDTKVSEQLTFTGRIPDEAVVALYRGAIALIFPSLYEGFGIPPLEAMSLGCPVVASAIPPLIEVCADAAVYVDPQSPDDLAKLMTQLIEDNALRLRLIGRGLLRATKYTWSRSATSLLAAIGKYDQSDQSSNKK